MNLHHPEWLKDALIYQIFPASFHDSNGDGIGDLPGITAKLDYIAGLGCNTIWLCPIYDSPFRDAGYDVRDYYKIAPRYGDMADLAELVAQLHARNMRILLDFVPGHTSDEHPWFQQSCRHQPNPFSNRYIWSERTFYAENQFRSPGQFINGYAERTGNYMANFFYFQPALNFGYADPDPTQSWQLPVDHPDVCALKQEIFEIMRFWLDKGIDGFRVDMASSLVKGFDQNKVQKAMIDFWSEVRSWWDRDYPDALLLAEWSNPSNAVASGFHLDFMIHFDQANGMLPFRGENFRTILPRNQKSYFDRQGHGSLDDFWAEFNAHRQSINGQGFLSLPSGNHDLPRYADGRDDEDLKVIQTFLMTLPQVPTLYYGDEIGMKNLGDLPSKEGAYDRTGARSPMQWNRLSNAGFSSAAPEKLYLPIDPNPNRPDVQAHLDDPDSLLQHIQKLAHLRKTYPALGAKGSLTLLLSAEQPYPLLYLRESDGQKILVVLNPLSEVCDVTCNLKGKPGDILLGSCQSHLLPDDTIHFQIPPLSSSILLWNRK